MIILKPYQIFTNIYYLHHGTLGDRGFVGVGDGYSLDVNRNTATLIQQITKTIMIQS